jgi:dopamine receptor D1
VETTRDDGVTANNHSTVVSPMSIHVGRKKLDQLEMEATRTLIMGVTSLCVMPCLNVVFSATFFACRLVFGQLECSNLNGIGFLIKEISLTPAVYGYGPIIFHVRNKELREAWANY